MGGGRIRSRQRMSYPNGTVVGILSVADAWAGWATSSREIICDPWYEWPHSNETCWDQTNRRPYIGGGPLRIEASGNSSTVSGVKSSSYSWGYLSEYSGVATCRVMIPAYNTSHTEGSYTPVPQPSEVPSASYLGPEAWNRYRPGKPLMSLGVSLGELRDFPRMLTQLKNGVRFLRNMGKNTPKSALNQAASQYLGYQFGWKQMVSDIQGLLDFQARADNYYNSLLRTSGSWVNRGGVMEEEEDVSYTITGTDYIAVCPLGIPQLPYQSEMTYSRGSTSRIWFKGRFKYYVPQVKRPEDMVNVRRRMLGLSITPDLVWNLVPWTWLIDWCSSIGASLSNLTSGVVDDLVSEYAFIMKQTYHYERTTAPRVPFLRWNGSFNEIIYGSLSGENFTSVKTRDAASPFGFGIDASNFTGRQIAILAALGLSR